NLLAVECDGKNFLDSAGALQQAIDWVRSGHGPALVHAHVIRPYSHSLSDDERLYKTAAEREAEAGADPIVTYPRWLIGEGLLDEQGYKRMCHEVDTEIQEITERVLHEAGPTGTSAREFLYSPEVDPCSAQFEAEPEFKGEPRTMVDSINRTLSEEMARNEKIVVFGQDVADCGRVENLKEVKGKGGVFKATMGLQTRYGAERCFNTPLAEASIIGRAIGMAARGLMPVPEIQFFDYIWPA